MHEGWVMNRKASVFAIAVAGMGVLAACAENPPPPPNVPQPVVAGTQSVVGVTEEQAVSDDDVITRLANARCDRSASCDRVGPGAEYKNRVDCLDHEHEIVRRDLNAAKCPAGIGAKGFAQCVKSVEDATCDMPGQTYEKSSHCKLDSLCMKVVVE
jgi:hypothetical protein